MGHSRFLWALQGKAASGAGSVHTLAGYRAGALGTASPPAWLSWWDVPSLHAGAGKTGEATIILSHVF